MESEGVMRNNIRDLRQERDRSDQVKRLDMREYVGEAKQGKQHSTCGTGEATSTSTHRTYPWAAL